MTYRLFMFRGQLTPAQIEANREQFARYEHVRDSESCEDDRLAVARLWERFTELGLGDPDFIERFPREFSSRVWEMTLASTFDAWGWELVSSRRKGEGPDLGIKLSNGATMWVEATVPENGKGEDALPARETRVVFNGGGIDRKVMLRYLGAISEKRRKHKTWREKGVVSAEDGFVIAINGTCVPFGDFDGDDNVPRIVKLAYGIGRPTVHIPTGDQRRDVRVTREPMPFVTKTKSDGTGVEIKTGFFVDGSAPEISALLFCAHDIKNRPEVFEREPGSNFVVALNPGAHVPFPHGQIGSGREFFLRLDSVDRRTQQTSASASRRTEL